jgi:hypothetical protein
MDGRNDCSKYVKTLYWPAVLAWMIQIISSLSPPYRLVLILKMVEKRVTKVGVQLC